MGPTQNSYAQRCAGTTWSSVIPKRPYPFSSDAVQSQQVRVNQTFVQNRTAMGVRRPE